MINGRRIREIILGATELNEKIRNKVLLWDFENYSGAVFIDFSEKPKTEKPKSK